MANVDKIQDNNAVLKLFKELKHDSIPLKLQLINGEYERLTHIVEICKRKKGYYFLIEYHENFRLATNELNALQVRFEFAARDNIHYAFETESDQISRKMIWIRFPEIVYCFQRRGHFRLEAPHGTRLYFEVNGVRYKLLVLNVSLGGTLGVLVSLKNNMEQELKLLNPKILTNVELMFPSASNNCDSKVTIKTCRIARKGTNRQTQKYEYAMEFKELAEDEQKKLTELFYWWQREYLRKRKLFKG